jgi:hypothetical protein
MTATLNCFTHVEKTGGHTFTRMLQRTFGDHRLCLQGPIGIESNHPTTTDTVWVAGHSVSRSYEARPPFERYFRCAMIREPGQRIFSHYTVICKVAKERDAEPPSLVKFCKTRGRRLVFHFGAQPRAWKAFNVIGQTERFDAFVEAVEKATGKSLSPIERQNVSDTRAPSELERKLIERACPNEFKVYDQLRELAV